MQVLSFDTRLITWQSWRVKEIRLTNGQVAIVDNDDYMRLSAFSWHAKLSPFTNSYYARSRSLPDENGKQRTIYMHREVMNAQAHEHVDHLSHDTLDQRKSNLRICTRAQNCANRRCRSDSTSGFKGVYFKKQTGKWGASVGVSGKRKHLGVYATPIEAALAYDRAALAYHGEFALTNKMLGLLPERDSPGHHYACAPVSK